jgi:beta-apo-4'-carotenal oxygenase
MTAKPIQPFEATPLDVISTSISTVRATYSSLRTKDIQYRLKQLRKLYWGITDYTKQLEEAIYKDLHKGSHEATITETAWAKSECMDQINNLEKWAKDEPVVNVPASFWAMRHKIRHEPLGVILVIGAFNYPVQLALVPAIGAIAAGNTVLLKPSEGAPHTAMVLQRIFEEYLDPEAYICVNGALPESQLILDHKFDKIVFTGSRAVGKIIARKAAETLTPTLLELGGQNPAFVSKHADIKLAARRLMWSKCLNAGQVCLSQNYAFVDRTILSQFIGELHNTYRTFMPQGAKASPDYCRINNKANFNRLKKMLDSSNGKIILGGSMDEDDLFIEPTIVLVDDVNDPLVTEETFGPIWTIIAFDSLDWAIDVANKVDPTPLSLFTFGNDSENEKVLRSVTSGGATVNDAYSHASVVPAPFGGVGQSGNGTYHGFYSFKAFSHQRTVARVPGWMDGLLRVRYMPYAASDLKRFQRMSTKKANFDRNGNVTRGIAYWISFILGLGGKSATGALTRWGVVFAVAVSVMLKTK